MANTILTPTQIVKEAARQFMNSCVMLRTLYRKFEGEFKFRDQLVGQSIGLKMPARYTGNTGATLVTEDHTEWQRPFTVYPQFHVGVSFTSFERRFSIGDFGERVLKNAMTTLANKVDFDILQMMKNFSPNIVGTPGTTPSSYFTVAQAGSFMAQDACPQDDARYLVLDPIAMASYADSQKGLFNPSTDIAETWRQGRIDQASGMRWMMDQNVAVHTTGPLGGTPLTNGANQGLIAGVAEFTDLVTDGWTASAAVRLNRGDIITIGGVFATNPVNKQTLGRLRQFVVASTTEGNVSSDGTGNATVRVRPAIIGGGQFQNCTNRAADNQAITVVGSANVAYPRHIAYHKEAFACAMFDLPLPEGVDDASSISDPVSGISLRYVRQYQISADTFPARFDIAYALGAYNPEWSCQITG